MTTTSWGIDLEEDQVRFLKVRFNCQTDGELRNVLQRITISLIDRQLDTHVDDLKALGGTPRIREVKYD